MKVIIIEDTVYKVSNKEHKQLEYMENKINSSQYPLNQHYEMALSEYFDENKHKYVKVGSIDFHFQL